jgi:FixJ family two-component response regulator
MLRTNAEKTAGSRPKIVLVEDDAGVRRSLQLLLQGRGYDVRAYASGVALLADPAPSDAACFIADYCMADFDGIEILSELRRRDWHGPAVLISAYASPDLVARATEAGFGRVVAKPFLDHFLIDVVGQMVRGEKPPTAVA